MSLIHTIADLQTSESLQKIFFYKIIIQTNANFGIQENQIITSDYLIQYFSCNDRVVNHENINKTDYCTISQKGVTRIRNDDETEFVTLDRWELEYDYFRKLRKVCFKVTVSVINQPSAILFKEYYLKCHNLLIKFLEICR